jgi:hypothetical protein
MKKKHKEQFTGLLIEFTQSDLGKLVMKMDPKHHVIGLVGWLLEEKRIILNKEHHEKSNDNILSR